MGATIIRLAVDTERSRDHPDTREGPREPDPPVGGRLPLPEDDEAPRRLAA